MGNRIMDIKLPNIFMYTWWLMIFFDLYLTIVDHIVGHLEIIIQVRFLCPLDPLYIINLNLKKNIIEKRKKNELNI
jgi:hypothetical protein